MFRVSIPAVFVLFFLLYGLINFWIGMRGWQFIGRHIPYLSKGVYWLVFWLVALSYLAGRFGRDVLPAKASLLLTVAGSYWMGFVIYFALAWLRLKSYSF